MSAVDESVKVFEDHIFNKALGQCACGVNLADTGHRTRAHREHLAEALDEAGLLRADGETRVPCKGGDSTCPCQDGDQCHYEGENPMTPPDGETETRICYCVGRGDNYHLSGDPGCVTEVPS